MPIPVSSWTGYPDTADLPALLRQIYDVLFIAAVCVSHRYLAAADTPEERRPSRLFLRGVSRKSSFLLSAAAGVLPGLPIRSMVRTAYKIIHESNSTCFSFFPRIANSPSLRLARPCISRRLFLRSASFVWTASLQNFSPAPAARKTDVQRFRQTR